MWLVFLRRVDQYYDCAVQENTVVNFYLDSKVVYGNDSIAYTLIEK